VCDRDNSHPATRTGVPFSVNGRRCKIDLCEEDHAQFVADLTRWAKAARRDDGEDTDVVEGVPVPTMGARWWTSPAFGVETLGAQTLPSGAPPAHLRPERTKAFTMCRCSTR